MRRTKVIYTCGARTHFWKKACLTKVMEITERYFRKHGEITPTTVFFTNEGFAVEEPEIALVIDKFHIADEMVAAAAHGATAVAFVAEAFLSECHNSTPVRDSERREGLVITYEAPVAAFKCVCNINRQRFGAPRLSKWNCDDVQANQGRCRSFGAHL